MLAVLGLFACNKVSIDIPSFNVTVDKTTVRVGDTVNFTFTGDARYISFYSGEPGHNYANRTRTNARQTGVLNQFSFTSSTQSGTTYQTNNLKVFASNNFNGKMDSLSIRNAVWIDITNRAKLATSSTSQASGTVDVSDFQAGGDTVYLAFRYMSTPTSSTSIAPSFNVGSFVYNNIFPDGTSYNYNTLSTDARYGGFQQKSFANAALIWAVNGTLSFPTGVTGQQDEDWVISQPFNLYATAADVSVPIKYPNIIAPITNYQYHFNKPGTYICSFLASNISDAANKQVVRQITIIVNP